MTVLRKSNTSRELISDGGCTRYLSNHVGCNPGRVRLEREIDQIINRLDIVFGSFLSSVELDRVRGDVRFGNLKPRLCSLDTFLDRANRGQILIELSLIIHSKPLIQSLGMFHDAIKHAAGLSELAPLLCNRSSLFVTEQPIEDLRRT